MALMLAALAGFYHVLAGDSPAYAVSQPALISIVALAQLMMLAGWHLSARVLLAMALIPLIVTLLSYMLPAYWIPLAAWDHWSQRLMFGLELESWRPSLLLALALTFLIMACATRARIRFGGPCSLGSLRYCFSVI
ncbi:hypothetical protein [Halomonas sp. BC04]|uniref:hypothetical protein n=1 Tax=Halomonas sp. BC04 TaxID=1403540 RepID=UPI0018CC1C9C|nr:hypothetical protein [Halomonas sp. BC04]